MSPRPPRPNAAALRSAEKIRELQAEIDAYKELIEFIAANVMAPFPADNSRWDRVLEYQRDIGITLASFLGPEVQASGPATMLAWLRDEISEPDYEVRK